MPAAPDVEATLTELLAANRARDPEWSSRPSGPELGGGLSNHQSMALVALAEMKAEASRLRAFAKRYDRHLEAMRPRGVDVEYATFEAALGRPEAFVGLVDAFATELHARGRDAVLRETLPKLWPSVGALAFHGVIRTAYAVRRDEDVLELAHGLAYWASGGAPMRALPRAMGSSTDAAGLVATALAKPELRVERGGLIDAAMREAASRPGFDEAVGALAIDDGALGMIADVALRLFLGTNDFTALHGMTGTHAVRVLLPWTSEPAIALRWHWQGLVAAALTVRDAKLADPSDANAPSWDELVTEARERDDDHDVKLVDTCVQQGEALQTPGYRAAAALRLGMRSG